MLRDEARIGRACQQYRALADPPGALDLHARIARFAPCRTADAASPVIHRGVVGPAQVQPTFRFVHGEGIGLFVQAVRGHRHRRRAPLPGHALQHEPLVIQRSQNRIAAARHAAQRRALDDLRHVHGEPGRKAKHRRQRCKDRRIARPAGDQHVNVLGQGATERAHAHLTDDMCGLRHLFLGESRHVVDAAQRTGAHSCTERVAGEIGTQHAQAEMQALGTRDIADDGKRRLQMRFGTRGPGRTDNQRHVDRTRAQQRLPQIASRCRRCSRHLAFAEIGGTDIDRAHVAADQIRLAREAGIECRSGNAVAKLPRCTEEAHRPPCAAHVVEDAAGGAHISTPNNGACCCAP